MDLAWPLGPADGRYLVRRGSAEVESAPTHVIVLTTLAAATPASRLRRRTSESAGGAGGEPARAAVTRATVVDVAHGLEPADAAAWLRDATEDDLDEGLSVLNWALHAHRIAAADPTLGPVDRRQALAARIGFGAGDEVAEGRWSEVRQVAWQPARRSRRRMLAPEGRLAAILTRREQPLVCEELALRARGDLDSGRARHAALEMLIVLDTAIAELSADRAAAGVDERVEELRGFREAVGEAAQTALGTEPSPEQLISVEVALGRVEAAIRARAAGRG